MEKMIRSHIQEILNIEVEQIGNDDNLIEVGLHSLAIMQLVEEFSKQVGRRFRYADFAMHPTIKEWLDLIQKEV